MERTTVTMCALWRRVWQLACVALVMAASASAQDTTGEVYQTNTTLATMAGWNKNINIELQDTNGKNISGLVAITKIAAFAAVGTHCWPTDFRADGASSDPK